MSINALQRRLLSLNRIHNYFDGCEQLMGYPPYSPRLHVHTDALVEPGVCFVRRLLDPRRDLARRHTIRPPGTRNRFLIHGHVDLVATIAPADLGVAKDFAKLPLEKRNDPA